MILESIGDLRQFQIIVLQIRQKQIAKSNDLGALAVHRWTFTCGNPGDKQGEISVHWRRHPRPSVEDSARLSPALRVA